MRDHRRNDPNSSGAQATARWRRRKAKGVTVVPVEVFDHEADMMIRLGWLDQRDRQHRRRVGRAVADLLERVLDRAARARGWL